MSATRPSQPRPQSADATAADAGAPAPWRRSLLAYSPALVLLVVAIADSARYVDPDLWWHIRSGQAILRLGHIVRHDPYSYSAPGHLWLNHEWLSDVVIAGFFDAFGVFGLNLMKFACAGATVALLALAMGETGTPPLAQFTILSVAAVAIALHMQYRPQLFTFAFAAALMLMFARDAYRRAGPLWPAIPLLAVWANMHAAFLIGVVALAIYAAVAGAQDVLAGRGWRRAGRLGAIAAASTLATLLTPFGILTWKFLARALTDPLLRTMIAEWRPLYALVANNLNRPAMFIYYATVIAIVGGLAVAFALSPTADDLALVAIAALMAAGAILSLRNVPLAVIAAVVPLAHHLSLIRERVSAARARSSGVPTGRTSHPPRAVELTVAVVAIGLMWVTGFFRTRLAPGEPYPVGAVNFMISHKLKGNVLCYYNWGGYIIFRDSPDLRVFVDGRFDTVYPRSVLRDFLTFQASGAGALGVLLAYPHDFVLIPPDLGAASMMIHVPGWKLVYIDHNALLFARAGTPAARLSAAPTPPKSGAAPAR
jgi:hypothetical protein